MPLPSPANSALQSIRSSCDRCRVYKLKCTVLAESDTPASCERCTRAKAPCVFGRRRRAARSAASDDKTQRPSLRRSSTSSGSVIQAVTSPAALFNMPSPAAADVRTAMTTPPCDTVTAAPARGQDIDPALASMNGVTEENASNSFYTYDEQPWESPSQGLHDTTDNLQTPAPDHRQGGGVPSISDWDLLQNDFSLDDLFNKDVELDLLDPVPGSQPQIVPAPGQQSISKSTLSLSGSTTNKTGTVTPSSTMFPGQHLLVLIAEMQQHLKMLEDGPWKHDSTSSLDDYPLGAILHLAEEFAGVAGDTLDRVCSVVGVPSSRAPEITSKGGNLVHVLPPASATTQRDEDKVYHCSTTSALLILVGYRWLICIYGIVLDHFQAHLARIPSSVIFNNTMAGVGGSTSGTNASTSRSLQLGELSYTSAVPGLDRIHTAVRMLLATLHTVEDQLGCGGAAGRNLVVTLLTQEIVLRAGELQDGYGGLSNKVRSVKELLREKIGL